MRSCGATAIWVAGLAVLLAATARGQKPGEIRVGSGPYTFAPVLVANTRTVPVTVVVRDGNGKVIRGLAKSRFQITDDGAPQAATAFSVETAPGATAAPAAAGGGAEAASLAAAPAVAPVQPRYVALLFDDVNSSKADLMEARNAAVRFMHEELGPGDRMAVFTTSSSQSLGFTRDRAALAKTITEIAPHPRANVNAYAACPRMSQYDAYQIAVLHNVGAEQAMKLAAQACAISSPAPNQSLTNPAGLSATFGAPPPMCPDCSGIPVDTQAQAEWELTAEASQRTLAAVRDVVEYTGKQPGQRIVVLSSSGFFSETLGDKKEQIIRDALRAGVVINALDAKGLYAEGPELSLRQENDTGETLLPLATFVFEELDKFPMREAQVDAMANLAAATGGLFFQNNNDLTLGFRRLGLAPGASYELAFTPKSLVHDGKLHQIRVKLEPPIPGATIEARRGYYDPAPGLSAGEVARDLYQAMASTTTASALPASVAEKAKGGELRVQVHFGVTARREKIAMVAGLFGADGAYVSGERGEVDLALRSGTFKKLRKSGLAPTFALTAAAGKYRLRVVVLNEANGAESEINRQVRIP
jgi:VWFA-related protein